MSSLGMKVDKLPTMAGDSAIINTCPKNRVLQYLLQNPILQNLFRKLADFTPAQLLYRFYTKILPMARSFGGLYPHS